MEENRIPFIALRGQTFFPDTIVGFDIGRDKSLAAVEAAMNNDKYVVVATQKDTSVNDPVQEDIYNTGVLIKLKQVVKRHEEYIRVLGECEKRVRVTSISDDGTMLRCDYEIAYDTDDNEEDLHLEALVRMLKHCYLQYVEKNNSGEGAARALIEGVEKPATLCNIIAGELEVAFDVKQTILEIDSVQVRIEQLINVIRKENHILAISKDINNRVVKNMNRGQKEYYLREQLQVIKEELGENDNTDDEIKVWLEKLDELKLEEKTDAKIRKEIDRFSKMSPISPDANVSRTYIETILELPWNTSSKTNINLKKAEKILNEDHYGMIKVKERILENLAVMHLAKAIKGPIICLVGPPGVGKTSIARSIARATNREFVRMSLGGVRDEAEIRGHRRTYVGAIPGRVINAIIEAGTNNPLFLLDEVDKIGADFRGDPASALLEVLDPEQNRDFTDHYLEIPFDLSKVMFITTANTTSTIPRPLLDRMEVIELSSYIEEEKVHIAQDYLIPKQIKEHAIRKNQLTITEPAVREIINYYTREAGVRNLEREIANICRKVAKSIVTEKKGKYCVSARNVDKYLGKRVYIEDMSDLEPEVGTTTGMAWTAVGGVTLEIETVKMPGTGKLILTGQMGDVMKESAQTAMGYIRSIAEKYDIPAEVFKDYDIQIHIPEGATPKDGPSAGVTMSCALFSCLTGKKANRNIAMTGEVTLRGKVLRIGGLKEKALAAYRQGIRKILIPKENEPDIEDIPASVRKKIEFICLDTVEDALREIINED
ncbi:MAG: endopeptidase La [Clostridiales bacterium]|nr:endopeptidase La [Candidatus Crickella merdequi]